MGAAFIDGMRPKLEHEDVRVLRTDVALARPMDDARAVVVFNPPCGRAFREAVGRFLIRSRNSGVHVVPVAIDGSCAEPRTPVEGLLPFLAQDVLSRRDLPASALGVAGDELARRLLAQLWPTCARDQLQLFLSYRRSEAPRLVRRLERALDDLLVHPVRDVKALRPGHGVRAEIVDALRPCDVLVFLDTPGAARSDWVRWELRVAMGMAIPIVWVRIGDRPASEELEVWPSEEPDLVFERLVDDVEFAAEIALRIRDQAFDVALSHVRRACVTLDRIRSVDRVTLTVVDRRQQIFCVDRPHHFRGRPRPEPQRELIQIFGRRASADDRAAFCRWLQATSTRESIGSAHQGAFLLSSSGPTPRDDDGTVLSTDGITYVEELIEPSSGVLPANGRELLLLGAFPRGTGSAQEVRDAVHEITTTWLTRGGRVRFGGHPSLTSLVALAADAVAPGLTRERVTIYQTRALATPLALDDLAEWATVVATDAHAERGASLTAMRERMVADGAVTAVVAIGGRTSEGGSHTPGLDEEVELARRRDLPVYLLGRPGGQAAALIERCRAEEPPWSSLGNAMSVDENRDLVDTDDYWRVARTIWERHLL